MTRLASHLALACTALSLLVACDGGIEAAPLGAEAPLERAEVSAPLDVVSADPAELASCHAAWNRASEALVAAADDAASCTTDSDCTVTVAETHCTGELALAVSTSGEEAFLLYADKLDARLCSDVAPSCLAGAASDDAPALSARCVAARCTLAE